MDSKIGGSKWSAIFATGMAGLVTGSLAFASAVDVRSLHSHIKNNDTGVITKHFAVWWPHGRDWMIPLLLSTSIAYGVVWRTTKDTKTWVTPFLCISLIGPYTKVFLIEDIDKLRDSTSAQVKETTERFCTRHHVRLVMAAIGFVASLVGLAEM